MRVLLTGAFGTIGLPTLQALLRQGHQVRCLDLPSRRNRRTARQFGDQIDIVWGDIRDTNCVRTAVAECDAVIHNAALLPPVTEQQPERAWAVNVEGMRGLITALEVLGGQRRLVFTSSVSVFGPTQDREPPRRASDSVIATDHYTRHKLECEALLRASRLQWLILRVGVAVEPGTRGGDPEALRMLFEASLDTRMEYVHPHDVARAQVNALPRADVWGKVLLIGGGPACQIRMRDLFEALFAALGLGTVPADAFGRRGFYTDWMDTEESQRLLHFQTHTFADYRRDGERRFRYLRKLLIPVRPLVRRYILAYSGPWKSRGTTPRLPDVPART